MHQAAEDKGEAAINLPGVEKVKHLEIYHAPDFEILDHQRNDGPGKRDPGGHEWCEGSEGNSGNAARKKTGRMPCAAAVLKETGSTLPRTPNIDVHLFGS